MRSPPSHKKKGKNCGSGCAILKHAHPAVVIGLEPVTHVHAFKNLALFVCVALLIGFSPPASKPLPKTG